MKNYIKNKIQRLFVSKKIMKFFYLYHYFTGGINSKSLEVDFSKKKEDKRLYKNLSILKSLKII